MMKQPPLKSFGVQCRVMVLWSQLFATNTTINGPRYIKTSEHKLDLYMHILECNIFMHDRAPCHGFKVASKFLRKIKNQALK